MTKIYPNAVLKRAIEALQTVGKRNFNELPGELKSIAFTGLPTEIQFNQYRIKYLVKESGKFCLHWYVVNGISGNSHTFYTLDYIGDWGKVHWKKLASDMTKV